MLKNEHEVLALPHGRDHQRFNHYQQLEKSVGTYQQPGTSLEKSVGTSQVGKFVEETAPDKIAYWTFDVTKEQELLLKSFGIGVGEDFPHAGNGFTVEGTIVNLWWTSETLKRDLIISYTATINTNTNYTRTHYPANKYLYDKYLYGKSKHTLDYP